MKNTHASYSALKATKDTKAVNSNGEKTEKNICVYLCNLWGNI